MRQLVSALFLFLFLVSASAQKHIPLAQPPPPAPKISAKILAAKNVFFDDQSGSSYLGNAALVELKRWNRFQIVSEKSQADLVIVLSSDPPHGGDILYSAGQTGRIDKYGNVYEDPYPTFHKVRPERDAYLSVCDRNTGELLWTRSHPWGGLLTGRNSAGARLITKLKKSVEK